VSNIRAVIVDKGEPVVLVGHSLEGVAGVTEVATSLVRSLVSVARCEKESRQYVRSGRPSTAVGVLYAVSADALRSTVLAGHV
jgi:hypothetical protein